jgi:hypothetical protein
VAQKEVTLRNENTTSFYELPCKTPKELRIHAMTTKIPPKLSQPPKHEGVNKLPEHEV